MQHEEGQRSNVEHISGFEQENEEETNEEPTGLQQLPIAWLSICIAINYSK